MKKALSLFAAILVFCGALVVVPAAPAHAAAANQDALAMALAAMLGLEATSSEAAFEALAAVGIQPEGGWVAGGVVTPEVMAQVNSAVTAAVASGRVPGVTPESLAMYEGGIVQQALGSTQPSQDRPPVSNIAP